MSADDTIEAGSREKQTTGGEDLLRAVFNEARDAIFITNDDRVYVDANPAACELLGIARDDLIGRRIDDFTAADVLPEIDRSWQQFLEQGEARGDYRMQHLGGRTIECEFNSKANVLPGLHLSIVRDVDKRRSMEASLVESEHRLRVAVDAAHLGTWELDLTTKRIICSRTFRAMFGLPPDAPIVRDTVSHLIHPEDRQRVREAMDRAIMEGVRYEAEYRIVTPAGALRWIRASGRLARATRSGPLRMAGVTLDITYQRRMDDERERLLEYEHLERVEAEHRLRLATLLASAFRDLAASLESREVTAVVCRAARELTDADGAAFIIREEGHVRYVDENAIAPLWRGQTFPIADCIAGRAILDQSPVVVEDIYADHRLSHQIYRPTFVRSVLAVPVRLPEPIAALAVYWSGTYRASETELRAVQALAHAADLAFSNARLYEQVRTARDEAEQASRFKDEFLATVSHELRTPLNAIYGWASMLAEGRLDEATQQRALETIERNARTQTQLIEDLLDVSRIITGKMRLELQPLDLARVVSAAVESVRPAADARRIRLAVESDAGSIPFTGDLERLQQIVWNIVSNAVKFTNAGGDVEVRVAGVESHVEIVVRDTGLGIDADFLPYVFDRFRQHDGSTTRAHGGLGLGLAIVRHLAELHGGSVRAESDGPGHGSTFVVTLPVLEETAAEDGVPHGGHPPAEDSAVDLPYILKGMRVLAVDDETDARGLIGHILERSGADVRLAASAAEAFDLAQTWRPDVLVSDIAMPGENGYVLVERIRALEAPWTERLVAIALSGLARPEDSRRALEVGYDAHVSKPIDPSELVEIVARLAGRIA